MTMAKKSTKVTTKAKAAPKAPAKTEREVRYEALAKRKAEKAKAKHVRKPKFTKSVWRENLDAKTYYDMLVEDVKMSKEKNRNYKLAPGLSGDEEKDFNKWLSDNNKSLPRKLPLN